MSANFCMTKQRVFVLLTAFMLTWIIIFYYDLRIDKTTYATTTSTFFVVQSSKTYSSDIQIVLWNSPQNKPTKPRLERMYRIVENMNKNGNEVCQLDETVIENHSSITPKTCVFSVQDKYHKEADVMVFFMFNTGFKIAALPSQSERNTDQLWVMHAMEPPPSLSWPNPLLNVMNWTMSYRMDSDVWIPYGKPVKLTEPLTSAVLIDNMPLEQFILKKTKLAVGVISHCQTSSRREKIIQKMNGTGIGKIDIFGRCGERKICGRYSANCSDFWNNLAKDYKFFLSFENSVCVDYITEKFWRTLNLGIVPVVYGGGNYTLEAPPNSYINIKDFKSVEDLMTYLVDLSKNDQEYSKFFNWRKDYKIQEEGWPSHDWCKLCKAVHQHQKNKSEMLNYPNLFRWWKTMPDDKDPACVKDISKFLGWKI